MKDGTPVVCPACGAEDFRFIYRGNIGREIGERFSQYAFFDDIFRCGQCGLLAQKQSRNTADIITLLTAEKYLDETIGHLNLAEKDRHFAMLLSRMRRYCTFTGKQILDVGANTGVFLNMLRNETPHLYGI